MRERDESDPERRAVELAQRGRIILDVSIADLEAAEAVHGAFHPIAWHFRNACNEARRSWERLRAELGTRRLEAALNHPPLVVLTLGERAEGSQKGAPRAVLRHGPKPHFSGAMVPENSIDRLGPLRGRQQTGCGKGANLQSPGNRALFDGGAKWRKPVLGPMAVRKYSQPPGAGCWQPFGIGNRKCRIGVCCPPERGEGPFRLDVQG